MSNLPRYNGCAFVHFLKVLKRQFFPQMKKKPEEKMHNYQRQRILAIYYTHKKNMNQIITFLSTGYVEKYNKTSF